MKSFQNRKEKIIEALDGAKKNARDMRRCLLRGEINQFGLMLEEGWRLKKLRDDKISNSKIDRIYNIAKKHGSIGGKLLGAGGGGHVLLLCEYGKKYNVGKKMSKLGCDIVPFSFESKGVQTWKINTTQEKVEI